MMNPSFNMFAVGYGYSAAATYRHYWTQMFSFTAGAADQSCLPALNGLSTNSADTAVTGGALVGLPWHATETVTTTVATTTPVPLCLPPACAECSFESDADAITDTYCGIWKNDRTVAAVWSKNVWATTPSSFTGPNGALEGQHYLYLEASSPRRSGDVVRLKTNVLKLGKGGRLSFSYHMRGSSIGELQVKVFKAGVETLLWRKQGAQGNTWQTADLNLSQFASSQVEIAIEAVRGAGWQGDIAVDRVTLNTGDGYIMPASQSTGSITFRLDSPAGQVNVSGLSSIFGAWRFQLSPNTTEVMKTEEGELALVQAMLAIFGRRAEILGTCSAAQTQDEQCPDTRSSRNLTSIKKNLTVDNSSLHVDFRLKIKFGDEEQASEVLAELSKFESGNAETLEEAAKEVQLALNTTLKAMVPVVVVKTPQPVQLQYKSFAPADGSQSPPIMKGRGKPVPVAAEEEESEIALGMILGPIVGIVGILLIVLVVLLLRSRMGRSQSAAALKVDPNPSPADDVVVVTMDALDQPQAEAKSGKTQDAAADAGEASGDADELEDTFPKELESPFPKELKPVGQQLAVDSQDPTGSASLPCNSQTLFISRLEKGDLEGSVLL
jgi:hypothetical protein